MKTILQIVVAAGGLIVATESPLSAAQTPTQAPGGQTQGGAQGLTLRGSDVSGAKVFNQQGEEVGHIRDVLLDPKTGNITYAVLGTGGWQGIGEQYTIVPWSVIRQDEQRAENFVVQIDREKLKNAPSFDRNQWSTVLQPDYLKKVENYFATTGQPQAGSAGAPSSSQPPQPDLQTPQKAEPEATPTPRQAEQSPRKDGSQKQRQSPGDKEGRVKTEP